MKPRISVVTASVRPEGLGMVNACLTKQTNQDFEWLIAMPEAMLPAIRVTNDKTRVIAEPPKRDKDFYRLNGAWNALVREAKGELLVFCVDWIWFESDALERFWERYQEKTHVGVTSIGHHYRRVVRGRPEVLWQMDTRPAQLADIPVDTWEGYPPTMWENAFCSLPKKGVIEAGGFDEDFDRVAGNSEKEMAQRMYRCGYRFQMSVEPALEIRNFTHKKEVSAEEWDKAYKESMAMWRPRIGSAAKTLSEARSAEIERLPMLKRRPFSIYVPTDEHCLPGAEYHLAEALERLGHPAKIADHPNWNEDCEWCVIGVKPVPELDQRGIVLGNGQHRVLDDPNPDWNRIAQMLTVMAYRPHLVKSSFNGKVYRHLNHFIFGHKDEHSSRRTALPSERSPGDPQPVMLDIGAALGSWALPAAVNGTRVYAFEPGTDAEALRDHIRINWLDDLVTVIPKLVSDVDGQIVPRSEIPWSSLTSQVQLPGAETVTVDAFVMMNGLKRVDFIKIDVDGTEMKVLRGAERTLKTLRPRMVVEVHDFLGVDGKEVAAFLEGLGYRVKAVPMECGFYTHLFAS